MPRRKNAPPTAGKHSALCGHAPLLQDLLAQFGARDGVSGFVDGGQETSRSVLRQQCRECRATFTVPIEQVASLVIQRQTQELFASISSLLRGKERLQ